MKRGTFILTTVAALLMAAPVLAQDILDQIKAQLLEQGYTTIEVSRTLLGRTQVEASSATFEREIIFDPRTGEILRDYWQAIGGKASPDVVTISNPGSGSSGSGSSGSGSSGSGSSGSGGSGSSGGSGGGSGHGSGSGSPDDDD